MRFDGIEMNGSINGTQTTLASAATVNIGAAKANSILITGTTNISAFDTAQAGTVRSLVFTGLNLTLVHSSNLQLPDNADFIAYEGYVMEFTSLGGGAWKCTGIQFNYIPQNVTGRADTVTASWPSYFGYPSTSALVAYSGTSITMADLITLRDAAGLATNQRFIITDATLPGLMVMAIGASTLATTAISYFDSGTASFGTYDLDTDTFIPYAPSTYLTLSKASFDTLVGASELIAGTWYYVTSAYTSSLYAADWNLLVLADSTNTIQYKLVFAEVGANNLAQGYVDNTNLASGFTFTLVEQPQILWFTTAQAAGYTPGAFAPATPVYLSIGGGTYLTSIWADGSAVRYDNVINIESGIQGNFDPTFTTFTPYANTWSATPTSDGSVITSPGTLSSGKISKNGNVMSYSFLLEGVVMDFTGADTGFVQLDATDFPFLPTGDHVVSGQLFDQETVGIRATSGANLRIQFYNRSASLTVTVDVSINGQCLV